MLKSGQRVKYQHKTKQKVRKIVYPDETQQKVRMAQYIEQNMKTSQSSKTEDKTKLKEHILSRKGKKKI